jgi:hypothetical protein
MKTPRFRRSGRLSHPDLPASRAAGRSLGRASASVARWLARSIVASARLAGLAVLGVDSARTRGLATTGALQQLPDSTLRWLAAGSAGMSAGFYLAGVPRPVVAASLSPAVMMGAAIVLRPLLVATPARGHWWSRQRQSGAS